MTGRCESALLALCGDPCAEVADMAGVSRLPMARDSAVARMVCSWRVEPEFVLQALHCGADGVMIVGCHPGEGHYSGGNYQAMRRFGLLRTMLCQFDIDPQHLRLQWSLATEAQGYE